MSQLDVFICVGEPSGDLQGSQLIEKLLSLHPHLKIGAIAGPRMRKLPIQTFFPMENLQTMGFIDVLFSLPKLLYRFYQIRSKILSLNPKVVVLIDYAEFHLQLAKHLRKKGFSHKLIHYISPSVWAWRKKRMFSMEKHLDQLLAILPFEKECFSPTKLPVHYVGHPLTVPIARFVPSQKYTKTIAIFPGSRKTEIARNLTLQMAAAKKLCENDRELQIVVSDVRTFTTQDNYNLMHSCDIAIATSGTVCLELALHKTPTVVTFAIRPLDQFIAQKICRIDLPYYSLPNILLQTTVFPELFGPHCTEENIFLWANLLLNDPSKRDRCKRLCSQVSDTLGVTDSSQEAAKAVLSHIDL